MTEPRAATAGTCWSCGNALVLPPRLVLTTPPPRTEHHIMLHRCSRVQAHHLAPEPARHDYGDGTLVAQLTEHLQRPGKFGLELDFGGARAVVRAR
ncbi:hypothetical protein [Streptomyces sp. NPDC090036]|uniref:hypothetical protein n=1 Tax=Streptomyces sp. NPDC090036 TaxID=3365926 RepID=UPI0037F12581